MKEARLELRMEKALMDRVDDARGDVSRTRFVERALEKALSEKVPSAGGQHGDTQPGASKPRREESPSSSSASPRASCECGSRSGKHELWCKGYGR